MEDFRMGDYRPSDKSSGATVLTFLLIGIGIGAVTALLFAPKTGKQMRKMVRRKYEDAKDAMDDMGDRAGEYWERGSEWASNAKEKVAPMVKKLRRD